MEPHMLYCSDEGVCTQRKYKQRQLNLIQSYKYCRRRRSPTSRDAAESIVSLCILSGLPSNIASCKCRNAGRDFNIRNVTIRDLKFDTRLPHAYNLAWKRLKSSRWLALICVTFIAFLTPEIAASNTDSAPVSVTTASSERFQISPLTAASSVTNQLSQSQPTPVSQEQRQRQQQNLFALLKPNSKTSPPIVESKSVLSSESMKTKTLINNKQQQYDDDYDDDDESESDDMNFSLSRDTEVLKSSGFMSDDGKQYQRAEKALVVSAAATSGQQQHQIVNNNPSCPKECKCLNDYFDCGKKHLDRVPAMPTYVQIMYVYVLVVKF